MTALRTRPRHHSSILIVSFLVLALAAVGLASTADAAGRHGAFGSRLGIKDRKTKAAKSGRTKHAVGPAVKLTPGGETSEAPQEAADPAPEGSEASPTETGGEAPAPGPELESAAPVGGGPVAGGKVYLGATVAGSVYGQDNPPWDMRPLETFEAHSGHKVEILQVHQEWGNIDPSVLRRIQDHGSVPMLITEYNDLQQVTNGSQDARIKAMNAALVSYGGPVLLRWDWEMNGDWYPWGGQSQASEWVAAYRHLHDVLTAPNVSWIWNPNVYWPNTAPGKGVPADPSAWYPGDAYVDWMGADGYSYGSESFSTVFGPTYELFQKLAPDKPIILPEWAASNSDGKKAAYIREALEVVPTRYPAIKAMVYYNDTLGGGLDWPLEDTPAAETAYQEASAAPAFAATPNLEGKLLLP